MNQNPFLEEGAVMPYASINVLQIIDLPGLEIEEEIKGKKVSQIFSTSTLIEEIKKNAKKLKINLSLVEDKLLPNLLSEKLLDKNEEIKETAESIVKKFGERLAVILLTLKRGDIVNKIIKDNWTNKHWDYWKKNKNVILVGGLASGLLGEKLKFYCEKFVKENEQKCYQITLADQSQNLGMIGCTKKIDAKNKNALIFDLGHSFMKRGFFEVENRKITNQIILKNKKSPYMDSVSDNDLRAQNDAKKLHEYIVNLIVETYEEIQSQNYDISNQIIVSIANYVKNGVLFGRGGYAKLQLLANNYGNFLEKEISYLLKREMSVTLIHDGTAIAYSFYGERETVCLSLGTSFGIGFPEY